jgi:hypothetical protein
VPINFNLYYYLISIGTTQTKLTDINSNIILPLLLILLVSVIILDVVILLVFEMLGIVIKVSRYYIRYSYFTIIRLILGVVYLNRLVDNI